MWYTTYNGNTVSAIVTSTSTLDMPTSWSVPSSPAYTYDIVEGADGNMWFTENYSSASKIAKVTPSGTFTEYTTGLTAGSQPLFEDLGPDNNVWFTENTANKVGKITTSGTITEYSLPASSAPDGITTGPDGNLWVAETGINKVAKVTTSGTITQYALTAGSAPDGIVTGPDNNLWIDEGGTNKIAKVSTAGSVLAEYSIPTASAGGGRIDVGSDGNLWFGETSANKVGKVTTGGSFTEYTIPTASSNMRGPVEGPDGNMWFAEIAADKIAKITPSGTITEYSTGSDDPVTVAPGPNGWMYYTTWVANKIGRMQIDNVSVSPSASPASPSSDETATFTANASSVTSSSITSVLWLFGDGSYDFGTSATHSYHQAGTYTVSAYAVDANGMVGVGTTSVTVTAGSLGFGTAPDVPTLPALTLNGQAQTLNGTMSSFAIDDYSGTDAGWNLSVQGASGGGLSPVLRQYCPNASCGTDSGGPGYIGAGYTLPAGSLVLNSTGASVSPSSGAPTLQCSSGCALDAGSPVKVLSAAVGNGAGAYTVSGWSGTSLALSTPASLHGLQTNESYQVDLLWSLSSGP